MFVKSESLVAGKLYQIATYMNPLRPSITPRPHAGTVLLCTKTTTPDKFVNFNGQEILTNSVRVYFLVGLKQYAYIVSKDAEFLEI